MADDFFRGISKGASDLASKMIRNMPFELSPREWVCATFLVASAVKNGDAGLFTREELQKIFDDVFDARDRAKGKIGG